MNPQKLTILVRQSFSNLVATSCGFLRHFDLAESPCPPLILHTIPFFFLQMALCSLAVSATV